MPDPLMQPQPQPAPMPQMPPMAPPQPQIQQPAPPAQAPSLIDQIDRDELAAYIMKKLKRDVNDRDEYGWGFMRQYDQLAYDGYKRKKKEPWVNASDFAVPLTATLLDTAHANTVGGIWANPNKVVNVRGVGKEDSLTAPKLEHILNWQVLNDIDDAYDVVDKTVHVAFKNGNAAIKVIQGKSGTQGSVSKVIWSRVPMEYLFLPVNARGAQIGQTDHIFELIPLDENEFEERKYLTNAKGKLVYEGLDDVPQGLRASSAGSTIDALNNVRDITSGTSLERVMTRDMYYLLECYLTYPVMSKSTGKFLGMAEIIATVSPAGGKVHRLVENTPLDPELGEVKRPYSLKWIPYPRPDRIYGDSLCWLIKQIQEELDHAHNQNINAGDIAINPPKFYKDGSGFDPETTQATPGGWYPLPNPSTDIYIPQFNVNPIFERAEAQYWEAAERRTGLTELFQGRQPDIALTATTDTFRINKSEIRFKMIYKRFEEGWRELMELTYYYDKAFMPDDTKIKVLGVADYKSVKQLFPTGMQGKYNFSFSSLSVTEQQQQKNNTKEFYDTMSLSPLVQTNPANQWRLGQYYAESKDILDFELIIEKPEQVSIIPPEEAIQRIMAGQYDLEPNPGINPNSYMVALTQFMKTDTYADADPEAKQAFAILMQKVQFIQQGQMLAMHDAVRLKQGPPMPAQPGEGAPGAQPGAGAPQGPPQ